MTGVLCTVYGAQVYFWVHGEWIEARNKQIEREPLRGSRDLFVPRYDSFPKNPEKRRSFLNYTLLTLYRQQTSIFAKKT